MANATVLNYRRSPAAGLEEAMNAGSSDAVSLREIPFQTQVGLRAELGTGAAEALEGVLGASLPRAVGQITEVSAPVAGHVLWLGPDEFLLVAGDEAERELSSAELAAQLDAAIGSNRGQAVELTANRTVLEMSGASAVDVLCKVVDVDVHPSKFAVGTAILTVLAGSGVVLWRSDEQTWRIMPRASFAPHTVNWLLDAMREYA